MINEGLGPSPPIWHYPDNNGHSGRDGLTPTERWGSSNEKEMLCRFPGKDSPSVMTGSTNYIKYFPQRPLKAHSGCGDTQSQWFPFPHQVKFMSGPISMMAPLSCGAHFPTWLSVQAEGPPGVRPKCRADWSQDPPSLSMKMSSVCTANDNGILF